MPQKRKYRGKALNPDPRDQDLLPKELKFKPRHKPSVAKTDSKVTFPLPPGHRARLHFPASLVN